MNERHIRLAVDCVVFNNANELLLIRRDKEPFRGSYALPGGRVEYGETTEAAARRELKEETGIEANELRLIGVYSDPARDPRGHHVSVAYLAGFPAGQQPQGGGDAASAEFIEDWQGLPLAFDHAKILADARKLRSQA